MKNFSWNFLIVIFLLCSGFFPGQNRNGSTEIKSKTDYTHQKSKVVFPQTLLGFTRERLVAYSENFSDIGATYKLKIGKKLTTMSIYVYPADVSNENLREQFLSFNTVVNRNGLQEQVLKPEFIKIPSEKVIINGIKTVFDYNLMMPDFMKGQKEQINKSLFSVYDCGKWNIKFRITSESYDEARLEDVEKLLLVAFNPLKIAEENKLPESDAPNIVISKTAQRDSLMLQSTIVEAQAKIKWLGENKPAAELLTGLSDFELASHEFAIGEKLKFYAENKGKLDSSPDTDFYFTNLQNITDNGYLKDFIYDQTYGVVIYSEGESRKQKYLDYLKTYNITEEFREMMYKIYY
ncbi:MAG: hypothetical protein ACOH1X_02385 [Kaistella sp.]